MTAAKTASQWLATLISIFIVTSQGQSTTIHSNNCAIHPSYNCLIQFINHEVDRLENNQKNTIIQSHWNFETQQKRSTKNTRLNASLQKKLSDEERYIYLIKSNSGTRTETAFEQSIPLMDADGYTPDALLIEYFTLKLEDRNANKIKRDLIEQTFNSQQSANTNQLIIELARVEIISGAPQKGLNTLNTAHIDGFSDALLFQEKQVTTQLAKYSEKLFLNPAYNETRCNQDQNPNIVAMDTFLNEKTVALLNNINQIPSTTLQTKLKLALLRLHKNAESCPFFSTLLINFFIQQEVHLYTKQRKSLLSLIYFARSLRRYYS